MYLNFDEYNKKNNRRFLHEGIFTVFAKDQNKTDLQKFKDFCKSISKNVKILEYTFFNDTFVSGRKTLSRKKIENLTELILKYKVIYYPEINRFIYIPELDLSKVSFLEEKDVLKNSFTLEQIKEKFL